MICLLFKIDVFRLTLDLKSFITNIQFIKEVFDVNDDLIEKLRCLSGRSSSSKLRNLMPVIDPQIKRGVSHEDIIATLSEAGIVVNIYTFRSALYSYRKKVRAGLIEPEDSEAPDAVAPIQEEHHQAPDAEEQVEDPLHAQFRESLGDQYLSRRKPIIRSENK